MKSALIHDRLSPFGIEVQADFSARLTAAEKEELRRLYAAQGLLVIRNQSLSMDDQLDACSIFGPVLRGRPDNYLVSNVHEDGLLGNKELLFHNDIPFVAAPYLGGSLHALRVEPGASPTRFASGFRAYERLPELLRGRIDGLTTMQVRERADGRRTRLTDLQPGDSCAVHALVGRQEGSGRPYLFVNMDMTGCVIGLSDTESDALLEELFGYLYDENEIYDHVWTPGDFVIWDNLAVQHARSALCEAERTLQRVSIAHLGYWEQCPSDTASYGELRTFGAEAA